MKVLKQLLALIIIVFIPFGIMIWFRNHQSTGFAPTELINYPLLFGGTSIVVLYLLKRFFLKEPIKDFNPGKGNWIKDWLWGLALTIIYFVLFFVERVTIANWLTFVPNMEMLDLILQLREDYLLLALWFGPVLWIGIALYEELIRVFILTSLWKFSSNKTWMFIVIFIASVLIGLVHLSQGSYGIVTITVKSLVAGFFFCKYRRLLPLIVAHVLYDGLQVAVLLITYP